MKFYLDFDLFINEGKKRISDCLLFEINIPQWEEILNGINPEHVWKIENTQNPAIPGGYQTHPHVTLLFGIHPVPTWKIAEFLQDYPINNFRFDINGIDIFIGNQYDVLKMTVVSTPELQDLHNKLKHKFPALASRHSEYRPHITIAYIKKEFTHLYINTEYKKTFYSNTIIHSTDEAKNQKSIILTDIEPSLKRVA